MATCHRPNTTNKRTFLSNFYRMTNSAEKTITDRKALRSLQKEEIVSLYYKHVNFTHSLQLQLSKEKRPPFSLTSVVLEFSRKREANTTSYKLGIRLLYLTIQAALLTQIFITVYTCKIYVKHGSTQSTRSRRP